MKILKPVRKTREETVDITCDICGKSCFKGINYEYLEMETHWGFESNKDLEKWSAQICEKCVDKHLISLITFKKSEYL